MPPCKHERYNSRDGPVVKSDFYDIFPRDDGLVDVFLKPKAHPKTADTGTDYDISVLAVFGIVPDAELEDDIRYNFDAWCEIAEEYWL